jgi:heavy metal-binding protein
VSDPNDTTPSPGPERPALSGSSIVALRVLLLVVAAAAVLVAGVIAMRDHGEGGSGIHYACPMHPEVRAAAPGSCPICQMALEPVGRAPAGSKGHAGMASMPDMTAVDNVRKHKIIDFVRVRSLLPNLREIRGGARVDEDHEISAVLYDDQIGALAPDEAGTFVPTASPETAIAVIRSAAPAVRHDRSTSVIRFHVATAAAGGTGALAVGQVGWLKLASKARAVLGVPASAVLQSPEGPYVLAWKPGGQFEKRPIEIGETFLHQGFAVVLSGLRPSDRVVSKATFFLDADRRLGGSAFAADGMPGAMPGTAPGGEP